MWDTIPIVSLSRLTRSESYPTSRRLLLAQRRLELLPSLEARMELVPVSHFRLAVTPAEIDFPPVHQARKINQTGEVILQFHTQFLQLAFVIDQAFLVALEVG